MKEIKYFMMASCPYCVKANEWLEELLKENPKYEAIEIKTIDEKKEPEYADKFDYYYVPTFYVGEEKVHEGAATLEKIRAVLDKALI